MNDLIEVNGIIIKVSDVGEYDRRCVILTKERGKITVFARGAKRMKSPYLAATNPFCYGKFNVYPSKDAYSLSSVEIVNFFEKIRNDYEITVMGMFFLELADYYSKENNDDYELLKVVYVSLSALVKGRISPDLIRAIYVIKAISVNGEFPGIPTNKQISDVVKYTISRIVSSDAKMLYSFDLDSVYADELMELSKFYFDNCIFGHFKTLDFL